MGLQHISGLPDDEVYLSKRVRGSEAQGCGVTQIHQHATKAGMLDLRPSGQPRLQSVAQYVQRRVVAAMTNWVRYYAYAV